MLLWGLVAFVVGIAAGLSGVGGGLIAVPMFLHLGGYSIKDASYCSLVVVVVAAFFAWFSQRKKTNYPVALSLFLSSALTAWLSVPLKVLAPAWVIKFLITTVGAYGLMSLWRSRHRHQLSFSDAREPVLKAIPGGLVAGFLNTMTGLGGGIFIIPWLTDRCRLPLEEAISCSLLCVFGTSMISFMTQPGPPLVMSYVILLTIILLVTTFLVQYACRSLPPSVNMKIRRAVLGSVTLFSMISVWL